MSKNSSTLQKQDLFRDERLFSRNLSLHYFYPIFRVESNKRCFDSSLSDLDYGTLTMVVFQTIVNNMGSGNGARQEDIESTIRTATSVMCPSATPENIQKAVEKLLLELKNASQGYCKFKEKVFDFKESQFETIHFYLFERRETIDGEERFALTREGLLVYLKMLNVDVSIEGRQVGEELLLEELLRTGAIDEALIAAERAKILSLQYELFLLDKKDKLKRHYYDVSWERDIKPYNDKAHDHVEQCIQNEQRILDTIIEQRKAADCADLVYMETTIRECLERHVRLSTLLTNFHNELIIQQELHAFRPRPNTKLASIYNELLLPLLELDCRDVSPLLDTICGLFSAPKSPSYYAVSTHFSVLFNDLSLIEQENTLPVRSEMKLAKLYSPEFTSELLYQAVMIIREHIDKHEQFTLSELLELNAQRNCELLQRAIIYLSIKSFDPQTNPFNADVDKGKPIKSNWFTGDDIIFRRQNNG